MAGARRADVFSPGPADSASVSRERPSEPLWPLTYAQAAPSLERGPPWVPGTTRQDAAKGVNNRAQSGDHSRGAENVMLFDMLNAPPLVISSMELRAAALSAVVGNAAW